MNIAKICCFIFLSVLLVGCVEKEEIADRAITNTVGIDRKEENLMEVTMVSFLFTPQSEQITKITSGEGATVEEAKNDAEMTSIYRAVPGKTKLLLFGKETAEEGIMPILDTATRDARVPDLMFLAVSDTPAKEMLTADNEDLSTDVGQYLYGVIEGHAHDHNLPRKTLQEFLRIYYDVGKDNVLPLFEFIDGTPKHSKNVLLQSDRIVGELSQNDITLINLMDLTVKDHLMTFKIPFSPFKSFVEKERKNSGFKDTLNISLFIVKGNSKTKLVDFDQLKFETNTKINFRLIEQNAGVRVNDEKVIHLLEKELSKKIESEFEDLLNRLQKHNADPFGYGQRYRMNRKGSDLTHNEWREIFPKIDVKFNVDVKISRFGTTD